MKITARDLPLLARVLIRTYGWRGIGRRAAYELSHRSGHLARSLPVEERVTPTDPAWSWPLQFDLEEIRRGYERLDELDAIREEVVADAERVLAGEMRFYGWTWKRVEWPPRWHVNPWTGYEYPRIHWTRISDFQPENGDIKDVWEMSRLPFTYLFARAWVLTDDDRYPEAWWRAIEDWAEHNPPNSGVNWKCGQETSLRGIAITFGLMTFGDHSSTTPERLCLVGGVLDASVQRLLPTLRYALSQRNNHALSEAVFLETMGLAGAAGPRVGRKALRTLREAIADQFYEDGWYAQHSFNYQRLAVHTLLWLNRVRSAAGLASDAAATAAIDRSSVLLRAAQDSNSGWLPNFGPNDGALLFPLSTCAHRDFRPLLGTLDPQIISRKGMPPWSEEGLWLRTEPPGGAGVQRVVGKHIAVMRGNRTHVVIRTGTGRHRPHHDDLLHFDLWIDGSNVLADPGTYRYTDFDPWANALAARAVHNVPYTDRGIPPRLGRFLSLSWPVSELVSHHTADGVEAIEVHRRDRRGLLCRTVLRHGDRYFVVDYAAGEPFAVRWTFNALVEVRPTATGVEIGAHGAAGALQGTIDELAPDEADPLGAWTAPGYGGRRPTTALVARSAGPALIAVFGPPDP